MLGDIPPPPRRPNAKTGVRCPGVFFLCPLAYPQQAPQTLLSVTDAPSKYVLRILQTILSVRALSPLCSRQLSWQARRGTLGCGRRASVFAIQGIGGAWSGEPFAACYSQASSGSTSCKRKEMSRPPQLTATAPSTVSAHPGDQRFPSCTDGSTPSPFEDALYFNAKVAVCGDSPAQIHKLDCLFVYLTGCIDCEGHIPPAFDLQAHDLCFHLGDGKPERRARSHDHRHHPLRPF